MDGLFRLEQRLVMLDFDQPLKCYLKLRLSVHFLGDCFDFHDYSPYHFGVRERDPTYPGFKFCLPLRGPVDEESQGQL